MRLNIEKLRNRGIEISVDRNKDGSINEIDFIVSDASTEIFDAVIEVIPLGILDESDRYKLAEKTANEYNKLLIVNTIK